MENQLTTITAPREPAEIDRAVMASLPRSIAFSLKPVNQARYDPTYGFDSELLRFELNGLHDQAAIDNAIAVLERSLMGSDPAMIAQELTRLRALTKARAEADADLDMTVAAYAEELSTYPNDAVIWACRKWARMEKWWPAWSELKDFLDRAVKKRRMMLEALQRRRGAQSTAVAS